MGDYWFNKFYGRNLNQELKKFQKLTNIENPDHLLQAYKYEKYVESKQKAFKNKFKKMQNPWIKCKDCGKLIPNDWNLVQRHYLALHIKDRPKYKEFGFEITPVPRIRSVRI